jgi:hypothetical protein
MAQVLSDQFLMAVAAGLVPGHSIIEKFGHSNAVGASIEDIWDFGGLYSFRTAAVPMTISSSDVDDTIAGDGARTVEVFGLDANYNPISEIVETDGQDGVFTTNSYLRIYRMIVRSAGDTGYNQGTIYLGTGAIVTGVPAVKDAVISFSTGGLGENQTLMAIYTIPAGHTGLIINPHFTNPQAKTSECWLKVRPFGEVFQTKLREMVWQNTLHINSNKVIAKVSEKTDIRMSATTPSSETDMAAGFQVLLINNEYIKGVV